MPGAFHHFLGRMVFMTRLLCTIAASFMVMAMTSAPSFADSKMSNMKMNSMKVVHMCPKGKMWVNGYTNKMGHKVAGYCRKK
jgi:hypothetical protein